tara:strand:+ start:3699 stop:4160 length:462 start_codon:yes stop_codon:yes gene_type:complete
MLENFIIDYWFWIGLSIILFIIEIFTFTSYSLWLGIGALLTGVIAFVFPSMSWPLQGLTFAVMAVVGITIGYKYFRSQETHNRTINDTLNQRGSQYVGRVFKVVEAIENGRGVIKVGDSIWIAKSDIDIAIDTKVIVLKAEGNVLIVKPLDKP